MLTDFYELTMANGYFELGKKDVIAYFDMFFRRVPDGGGFAIMAGLEQVVDYLQNLEFKDEDIQYLRAKNCFSEEFLEYLRNFEFKCDVWAIPEGMPIFPYEPVITVRGPITTGSVYRDLCAHVDQSSVADRYKSGSNRARGRRQGGYGVRLEKGPGD